MVALKKKKKASQYLPPNVWLEWWERNQSRRKSGGKWLRVSVECSCSDPCAAATGLVREMVNPSHQHRPTRIPTRIPPTREGFQVG